LIREELALIQEASVSAWAGVSGVGGKFPVSGNSRNVFINPTRLQVYRNHNQVRRPTK